MAHQLGLGGYGSDEEGSGAHGGSQDGSPGRAPMLLDSYHSAEAHALDHGHGEGAPAGGRGFNAAPDIQEQSEAPNQLESDHPQTSGGEDMRDANMPSRPPSRAVISGDPSSLADVYLADLPPELRYPPPGNCNPTAVAMLKQIKDQALLHKKSFIDSLRGHAGYSNPDLLQQLVKNYDLKEKGSAFEKDVFDPDGLPREDHIDQMMIALEREQERKKAARLAAAPGQASIAFERGTGPQGMLPASHSAGNLQQQQQQAQAAAVALVQQRAAAAAAAAGGGLLVTQQLREQAARAQEALIAQAKKKSKWDTGK